MRHAIAILCHNNFNNILNFVDTYRDKDIDFFIHVDKKTAISDDLFKSRDNVFVVPNRISVTWGHYSIVKATLELFNFIKSTKEYSYIHLISGNDVPLKSKEDFKKYFLNKDINFISYSKLPLSQWKNGGLDRFLVYYPNFLIKRPQDKLIRITRGLYKEVAFKSVIFRRKCNFFNDFYGGSAWFSLTSEGFNCILNYLSKNKDFESFFDNSLCSDEIFFHTILLNNISKDKISNNCLRYIDWSTVSTGSPKNLDITDIYKAREGDYLFARKVVDSTVFKAALDLLIE